MSSSRSSFANTTTLLHANKKNSHHNQNNKPPVVSVPKLKAVTPSDPTNRRHFLTRLLISSTSSVAVAVAGLHGVGNNVALAESWGTRSFIKEKFFEPELSPEDAVARIKQTAEGMHSLREMVDRMAWRYLIFYIRVKESYLSQDLKIALNTLPQVRRKDYVRISNDLVDNMAELDYYVRTPKVYESYLYYEKALKNLDDIVAMLA